MPGEDDTKPKKFFAAAAVIFLIFSALAAYGALFIKTISIDGARTISERSILKRIGVPVSGGRIFLPPGAVEKAMRSDLRVKEISVKRNFRGGISIRIEQRIPRCLFAGDDGKIFYADRSGVIFGPAPAAEYGADFPVVRASVQNFSNALLILDLSESEGSPLALQDISEIAVSADGVEIFTRAGARFDLGADIKSQWKRLEAVTRNLRAAGRKAKYVNLRGEGAAVVNFGVF